MSIDELFQSGRKLAEFSTFGIGGPIRHYLVAKEIIQIEEALRWRAAQGVPYFLLGKGSNCLFSDAGFDGLVIHNQIDFCEWGDAEVHVGAGYSFSLLGVQTARKELSGLEFASGIPGSVGGAVFMNAGANGSETCQPLSEVRFMGEDGTLRTLAKQELEFSYRTSSFQKMKGCIVSAKFKLIPKSSARKDQLAIVGYRLKTQPYKDKSAGCIFRNPSKELSAGSLIDRCGLKGLTIGGAKVSEMHANFIVNAKSAQAADVAALISEVQRRVFEQTGIHLEPEVRVI